jgi:hypothetical protein
MLTALSPARAILEVQNPQIIKDVYIFMDFTYSTVESIGKCWATLRWVTHDASEEIKSTLSEQLV